MQSAMSDSKSTIKNFIFLVQYPWSERDWQRFGGNAMKSAGLDVRVLLCEFKSREQCQSWLPDFEKALPQNLHDLVVIVNFNMTECSIPLFQFFSQRNIIFGFLKNASQPNSGTGNELPRIYSQLFYNLKRFRSFLQRMYKKVKPASFIVIDGVALLTHAHTLCTPASKSKTKIIKSHSLDYESFRTSFYPKNSIRSGRAIFIDQFLEGHPDFSLNGTIPPCDPFSYELSLENFFSEIEKTLALEVVVAIHPKRPIRSHFAGSKCIQGETLQLIADSKLVLGHYSTALGMAVIHNLPVMILGTTELMKSKFVNKALSSYATALGVVIVDIDQYCNSDIQNALKINETCFRSYFDKHIKFPGSPNLPWWKILLDELAKNTTD